MERAAARFGARILGCGSGQPEWRKSRFLLLVACWWAVDGLDALAGSRGARRCQKARSVRVLGSSYDQKGTNLTVSAQCELYS